MAAVIALVIVGCKPAEEKAPDAGAATNAVPK